MEQIKRTPSGYILYFLALIGFLVVSVVLWAPASHAASGSSSAANVLKVSPVRSDIQIDRGQTQSVDIYVTNITSSTIAVEPIENDFVAGDENGTPALILNANQYAPTHSLKRFMAPLQNFMVAPGKTAIVALKLTVPKTAQPGGYFGAVRFAPSSPDGGAQVNLSASVASLVLLTVPGPTTEKLAMTNFDVMNGTRTVDSFTTSNKLNLLLRFENEGNLQESPFGQINVQKNGKVVDSITFNNTDPKDEILPDSARRWTIPLKGFSGFGHYTVSGTLTYGKTNQSIDVSKSFWVIPWMVIIIAGIALLVLIAIIVAVVMAIRHRPKRAVRRYGRR